jgi:D-erythro-7,8-dihydroneopterin triphosphate epimerase
LQRLIYLIGRFDFCLLKWCYELIVSRLKNVTVSQTRNISDAMIQNAIINITNLRLRTFIGFNEEERQKQQDIVINAEIHYPANHLCLDDDVDNALNYKVITKSIIKHVEDGRFLLLEKLTSDILSICSEHPWVNFAQVKIDKPHALRFADSVSLSLQYQAPNQQLQTQTQGVNL